MLFFCLHQVQFNLEKRNFRSSSHLFQYVVYLITTFLNSICLVLQPFPIYSRQFGDFWSCIRFLSTFLMTTINSYTFWLGYFPLSFFCVVDRLLLRQGNIWWETTKYAQELLNFLLTHIYKNWWSTSNVPFYATGFKKSWLWNLHPNMLKLLKGVLLALKMDKKSNFRFLRLYLTVAACTFFTKIPLLALITCKIVWIIFRVALRFLYWIVLNFGMPKFDAS